MLFRKCASLALEDLSNWLEGGGEVAVSWFYWLDWWREIFLLVAKSYFLELLVFIRQHDVFVFDIKHRCLMPQTRHASVGPWYLTIAQYKRSTRHFLSSQCVTMRRLLKLISRSGSFCIRKTVGLRVSNLVALQPCLTLVCCCRRWGLLADARWRTRMCTYWQEVKVTSPDYKSSAKDEAVDDFKLRIQHYMVAYEPIDEKLDKEYSFIKIFNQGEKFLVNKVQGFILIVCLYCACDLISCWWMNKVKKQRQLS